MPTLQRTLAVATLAGLAAIGAAAAPPEAPTPRPTGPFTAFAAEIGATWNVLADEAIRPAANALGQSITSVGDGVMVAFTTSAEALESATVVLLDTLVGLPQIPARTVEDFVAGLGSGRFDTFAGLVDESGFAIADVKASVGLIPDLSVEFKHMRNLSDEEMAAVRLRIEAYTEELGPGVGYIERAILRSLVRVGDYAGDVDINAVIVHLFPFPGVSLRLDPFAFEDRRERRLIEALGVAMEDQAELDALRSELQAIQSQTGPAEETPEAD